MEQPEYTDNARRKNLDSDVEQLLSKEMKSMFIQERVLIQEEVHGVAELCPEETPVMIAIA